MEEDPSLIKNIKDTFKATLAETYNNMGNHRAQWKPILANIAIAATGVGLIILLFKVISTGTLFFNETNRQVKIREIDDALESKFCDFPVFE
ncbi:MAG: hypothetical protein QM652_08535 [Legionella sp.]|uniref:hypothetical protein n=1 Tax=Legionella sp. TaxID=459 RepID=UPI0039E3A807